MDDWLLNFVVCGGSVSVARVERFWCVREGDYALDADGFLRDPDATWRGVRTANPGVLRTRDLKEHPCVVLLGEPGAGKSTATAAPSQLVGGGTPVISINLGVYGSEDRLVREVFDGAKVADWSAGSGQLCLVLDSLDEAQARIPQVGAVIADRIARLPYHRLILRVACRTTDWPAGLEQSLKELFGAVVVVELLPLRRSDASLIAGAWCDAPLFLEEVERAGAGPLAARPLTLRFLARDFAEFGRLPQRGAALYRAGVRSLCAEQNVSRRDSRLDGALMLDERIAVVRRIAAATVFGGASAIWTGSPVEVGGEDIALDDLVGATEPSSAGTVAVTAPAVLEALRTGLFTSRGGQRLGWAHATFADFLAAEWVIANNLAPEQARPLFLGPDGRCWPQTRLAAVWATASEPERFGFLPAADPGAFEGEVELPGDALRSAVVDGLFATASTLTADPWERSYRALRHQDVADQLRAHLRDSDPDRRRLAYELADQCAALELRDDLAAIAVDATVEIQDRVAAGRVLTHLPDPYRSAALRPLALGALKQGDDPFDDLKGVALLASWPQAIANDEVFSVLAPARKRNYYGAYSSFLDRFRAALKADDVDAGLRWLLRNLDAPVDDPDLAAIANRLLVLAAHRRTDPVVVEAFSQLVLARVRHFEGLLFEDFRGEGGDPLADPMLRRAVAAAVLEVDPSPRVIHRLGSFGPYPLSVVRADDLAWLADLYAEVSGAAADAVRSLFQWTYDGRISEHRDAVLGLSPEHPLYIDLVHTWVDAVNIDSPEADEARRAWQASRAPARYALDEDNVNEEIESRLAQFDRGEAVGFWYSMRLLTVPPGTKAFGSAFDADVVGMKRWPTVSDPLRARIISAAERYLRLYPCEPDKWLGNPELHHFPSAAGYVAMVLLLRAAPERLHVLPQSVWVEWAPVLATWSTELGYSAAWEDKARLLEFTHQAARDASRVALLARVTSSVLAGKRPSLMNEAVFLWDENLAEHYLALACSAEEQPLDELVTTLARCNFDRLRGLLLKWIMEPTEVQRRRLAALTLIDCDLEGSWGTLKSAFDGDLLLAEHAFGRARTLQGLKGLEHARASVLADIYIWLREKFPPESDPQFDAAHAVGPREETARLRDELLHRVRDEGSPASLDAMRDIAAALPADRWLRRALAIAEAAFRRNQWTPTPLEQLMRLGKDRRALVAKDSAGLAAAVMCALEVIQARLTGATPESHYLWDVHSRRPKSEEDISDYLKNELQRHLVGTGAIVNREVQIRRTKPRGVGERTDILVEAAAIGESQDGSILSLPVEIKGAWNAELISAMRSQLVDRYMHDVASDHGIYVVAWPDLASWTDPTDGRSQVVARLDRPSVVAELALQASALERDGLRVHVVHLNVDYRRPY